MEPETNSPSHWHMLPDPVLLYIFSHLSTPQLVNVRRTCRNWLRVATDELLWKKLFLADFKLQKDVEIAPGRNSWFHEYRRLKYLTPTQETEVLTEHSHQVLHVSFSHNGEMFASSSKDGYIKVWTATYPAEVCYSKDMKSFSWNYTQFSQFNESDTLLLVSGVHFGAHTASGEIAVFNIQNGFVLQCRVLNKPYDTFGTWYTDDYLLSGRLHFLGHLVSCSSLWLNKAWQESESEKKPIIKRRYRFFKKKASSIRTITVAHCLARESEMSFLQAGPSTSRPVHGNPMSRDALASSLWAPHIRGRTKEMVQGSFLHDFKIHYGAEGREACTMDSPIRYSQEFRRGQKEKIPPSEEEEDTSSDLEDPLLPWDEEWSGLSEDENRHLIKGKRFLKRKNRKLAKRPAQTPILKKYDDSDSDADSLDEDKIVDPREKFLIFTLGAQTYTPHQIGFKRIKPFKFGKRIAELNNKSVEEQLKELNQPRPPSPNWHNEADVAHWFDHVDHIIDLHGHIIGMGVSPDHRYLYVNSRSWPQGYVIENPLTPPPIAQEIDIHVIDLITLKEVGTMLRSHKAYTPNDECFFIFLDVSEDYVASGAEDNHGYVWDRHYGTCLKRLPHDDVVNSVAFNPKDPEMLVTASDDFTLKVWRSKNRIRELASMQDDERSADC